MRAPTDLNLGLEGELPRNIGRRHVLGHREVLAPNGCFKAVVVALAGLERPPEQRWVQPYRASAACFLRQRDADQLLDLARVGPYTFAGFPQEGPSP